MAAKSDPLRHFLLGKRFREPKPYATKGKFFPPPVPLKERQAHGAKLLSEVQGIEAAYSLIQKEAIAEEHIRAKGLILEIILPKAHAEETGTLDKITGLQLLNQRPIVAENGEAQVCQTWFVPDGYLSVFEQKLNDYLNRDSRFGKPQYHRLIASIESIRMGALEQLWTEIEPLPADDEDCWWEAWLRASGVDSSREEIEKQFRVEAERARLRVGNQRIKLPEHTILAVRGSVRAWRSSLALLNCLAEIRLGRDFAGDFEALPVDDQRAFAADLGVRLEPEPQLGSQTTRDERVALCVLDTGVNRGHPLLKGRLPEDRNLSIKYDWGTADDHGHAGHGTPMTGLCLYGDLSLALNSSVALQAPFLLEAVKIVPPPHLGNDEEKLAAGFTQNGVNVMEALAPHRRRIWCIATSLEQPGVDGRPGSWSALLDSLAAGSDDVGAPKRLLCLASGNVPQRLWNAHPKANEGYSAHPPAQAWNVLVVGSFTQLDQIRSAKKPQDVVAKHGAMAPTNSTSCTWDNEWPNTPDLVFEGGNAECDEGRHNAWEAYDLSLLSTAADMEASPFCTLVGTSPAAALAARMAAQIQAAYPDFWPETVRGLMVHTAQWTGEMLNSVQGSGKQATSSLLRKVGYGAPRLRAALECAASRATLISQAELQPFQAKTQRSAEPSMHELHIHSLPWPREKLLEFPAETVRMRVTLSYFIEPNPGNRGYTSTYRYASCQLRFRVSAPGETLKHLVAAVDQTTHDELGGSYVKGNRDQWVLDVDAINKGSVHSNVWEGSAADLASMQHIIVYPVSGWWKTRKALKRANSKLRYALLVTIEAQNPDLDIYTEIANVITPQIPISAI